MCYVVKRLLEEKLIDDFYEKYESVGKSENTENFMNQLKAVPPAEQQELLECLEANYAERCGEELQQFADLDDGSMPFRRQCRKQCIKMFQ